VGKSETMIGGYRRWLGHTLRRFHESITRKALSWNLQGKQQKDKPRNTWRRKIESEIKRTRKTWIELKIIEPWTGGLGKMWLWTYASRGPKGEEEEDYMVECGLSH
jgi:hypothetical protein